MSGLPLKREVALRLLVHASLEMIDGEGALGDERVERDEPEDEQPNDDRGEQDEAEVMAFPPRRRLAIGGTRAPMAP